MLRMVKGPDCKLGGIAVGGSNPSLLTTDYPALWGVRYILTRSMTDTGLMAEWSNALYLK